MERQQFKQNNNVLTLTLLSFTKHAHTAYVYILLYDKLINTY